MGHAGVLATFAALARPSGHARRTAMATFGLMSAAMATGFATVVVLLALASRCCAPPLHAAASCTLWFWVRDKRIYYGDCGRFCVARWRASLRRGFLSVCLARLLAPELSRCVLRQAASVFLLPLVGSFFALSCWRKPSYCLR